MSASCGNVDVDQTMSSWRIHCTFTGLPTSRERIDGVRLGAVRAGVRAAVVTRAVEDADDDVVGRRSRAWTRASSARCCGVLRVRPDVDGAVLADVGDRDRRADRAVLDVRVHVRRGHPLRGARECGARRALVLARRPGRRRCSRRSRSVLKRFPLPGGPSSPTTSSSPATAAAAPIASYSFGERTATRLPLTTIWVFGQRLLVELPDRDERRAERLRPHDPCVEHSRKPDVARRRSPGRSRSAGSSASAATCRSPCTG